MTAETVRIVPIFVWAYLTLSQQELGLKVDPKQFTLSAHCDTLCQSHGRLAGLA